MQLNSIIVEDEKLSSDSLHSMLDDLCPQIKVIAEASNAKEAKQAIEALKPDVVFMDIEIDNTNALDLLLQLKKNVKPFQTIIVTGHSEYSVNAVKVNPIDYLLKPLDANELMTVADKLYRNHINNLRNGIYSLSLNLHSKLLLPTFNGFKIIASEDIIHFDADNHYTRVHLSNEPVAVLSKPIKYFEEKLNTFWFFRIHKSHIINFYHFREYLSEEGGYAVMSNGKKIPVSRFKLEDFFEFANILGIRI